MTKHQIEVITSVERRRRWSREEKERLVAATFEPEARVSEIARSAGIHVSQLFRWRKELCQISAPTTPTALLALAPAAADQERGRDIAAWLRHTPLQRSTGRHAAVSTAARQDKRSCLYIFKSNSPCPPSDWRRSGYPFAESHGERRNKPSHPCSWQGSAANPVEIPVSVRPA